MAIPVPLRSVVFAIWSGCSIRCRMCSFEPRGKYMSGDFRVSFAQFERAFWGALPYLSDACVRLEASAGEPLDNPDAGQMLAYLTPHVRSLSIVTNGMGLLDLPRDALTDRLHITLSLEADTCERHESIAVGADWYRIAEGLNRARALGCHWQCNTVLSQWNFDRIVPLIEMLASAKCRQLRLMHPVKTWRGEDVGLPLEQAQIVADQARTACEAVHMPFADSVSPYLRLGTACMEPLRVHPGGAIWCPAAFGTVVHRRRGWARCQFGSAERIIGSIDNVTLLEAHNSEELQETRSRLLAGDPDAMCRRCINRTKSYEADNQTEQFVATTTEPHPYSEHSP